jgi:hypothetical protein
LRKTHQSERIGGDWNVGSSLMFLDSKYRKGGDHVGNHDTTFWAGIDNLGQEVLDVPVRRLCESRGLAQLHA